MRQDERGQSVRTFAGRYIRERRVGLGGTWSPPCLRKLDSPNKSTPLGAAVRFNYMYTHLLAVTLVAGSLSCVALLCG